MAVRRANKTMARRYGVDAFRWLANKTMARRYCVDAIRWLANKTMARRYFTHSVAEMLADAILQMCNNRDP